MAASRQRRRRNRSPLTVGLIALAIIVVGVWLGFTKDIPFTHGFRVKATFASANSLRLNSPVRIAGVAVGKVKKVEAKEGTDEAVVTLELKKSALPIHEDATAKIRPRIFLEGNFFVDLQPGHAVVPEARGRRRHQGHAHGDPGPARRGADLAAERHPPGPPRPARRPRRRPELQAERGRRPRRRPAPRAGQTAAESFNDAYRDSPGALKGTAQVNEALLGTEPDRDVARLLAGTAKTTGALIRNEGQLKDLITNFNTHDGGVRERGGQPARLDPPARADARERQRRARLAQPRLPADARLRARHPARRARDARHDRGVVPVGRPGARS